MRTLALDLGAQQTSWCEVRNGKVLGRGVIHHLDELEKVLEGGTARVGFEACREAVHVHEWLTERGHEAVMIDTTRVRAIGIGSHSRKNDRADAELLALALERDYAAEAYGLSPFGRALREYLEAHRALTQSRAQMVTHVRGLVAGRGMRMASCEPERFVENVRAVELPEAVQGVVQALLFAVQEVQRRLADVDTEIGRLLEEQNDPVVERLASVTGVSLMVAAAFISVIDDPRRFRHASEIVVYLGLCSSKKTTGGRQRLGSITKRGNAYARPGCVNSEGR